MTDTYPGSAIGRAWVLSLIGHGYPPLLLFLGITLNLPFFFAVAGALLKAFMLHIYGLGQAPHVCSDGACSCWRDRLLGIHYLKALGRRFHITLKPLDPVDN